MVNVLLEPVGLQIEDTLYFQTEKIENKIVSDKSNLCEAHYFNYA